jgi:hypothetical protein
MTRRIKTDDTLIRALASGATVEDAARQCGVSEALVRRKLRDERFRRELARCRGGMTCRVAGVLTAAGLEAVKTLLDLQKPGIAPATRLGAARAVLEVGMKLREVIDLAVQLIELDAKLGEAKAARNVRLRANSH